MITAPRRHAARARVNIFILIQFPSIPEQLYYFQIGVTQLRDAIL
jgi:hypothetical protein